MRHEISLGRQKFCPTCHLNCILIQRAEALSLLYPNGALTSYKKSEKCNEQSLRYQKTDYEPTTEGSRTTDKPLTRVFTKDPAG